MLSNYLRLAARLTAVVELRLLLKLGFNGGYRAVRSVQLHKRRLRCGRFFPPFLFISVTNRCNLCCQGCWVDVTGPPHDLPPELLDRTIREARRAGNSLFGILGGEPFLYPHLFEVLERHTGAYFLVFTNGHFVSDKAARRMRQLGNVSPLISIEGLERVSEERRGRPDVWRRTMAGLQRCVRYGLLTGVCTSLCKNNLAELLTERWLDRLIELGVAYVWYYLYRPVGPQPRPELALSAAEQRAVRQFIVHMRTCKPIVILDTYFDDRG
ncbi:MAG TPA: radical SAM protein, partial [Planctomycetaceae bacterium]|nr:radical SAM protein [Planctomycetaceae bacterium]